MSRRSERIGETIRGELARPLHAEVTDPRIGLVTLTRIDVAPDLSHAKVYWSCLDALAQGSPEAAAREAEAARGLASAAGFLRTRLAGTLTTRRVPELRFVHDASLSEGAETLRLLKEIGREPH